MAYHTETAGANQGRVLAPFMSTFSSFHFFFKIYFYLMCANVCLHGVCAHAL